MLVFYDGKGEWFLLGNGESVADECISAVQVTGVFKLNSSDAKLLKYTGGVRVKNLLPCYAHEDGVTCEDYTEYDDVYFKLHEGLGLDESIERAAYLGKIFDGSDVVKEFEVDKIDGTSEPFVESKPTSQMIKDLLLNDVDNTISSAKEKRSNQLHCLIWRIRQYLLESQNEKVTAKLIWDELKNHHENHDSEEIIQEVTRDKIVWISFNGHEQSLARKSFPSAVAKLIRCHSQMG